MKNLPFKIARQFVFHLAKAFANLVYPPNCWHCKGYIKNDRAIFCEDCLTLLQLIDPDERCPRCFSFDYCPEKKFCLSCFKRPSLLAGMSAAFDYLGPAATLVKRLKYFDQPHLAEGVAAYLAAQFLRLNWPMPDFIIPVPITFTHWLERGYNQSQLLAKNLSKLLSCPFQESLIRKSGDFSQAGLSRSQRMRLNGSTFQLKKDLNFEDKCILLIDDVTTTGTTLEKCAEALIPANPSSIYGLTVCRAIK